MTGLALGDSDGNPAGRWVSIGSGLRAFVPYAPPPQIGYSLELVSALSEADRALGRIDGIANFVPNPALLVVPFLKMEAVLSSRIEGTQTTPEAVFQAEIADKEPVDPDTQEVVNYLDAMYLGLGRLGERPLSLALVRDLHARLLTTVRGGVAQPGRFREEQVHIGPPGQPIDRASYIPPPPWMLPELLEDWERFLNADLGLPPLVHCAILHGQFELIHPFLDGNGRIGRLLMSLFLIARRHLSQPVLFLSAFFERYRSDYYGHLRRISEQGSWTRWLAFFLEAVAVQSRHALTAAQTILGLRDEIRGELQAARAPAHLLTLVDSLFQNPYTSIKHAAEQLGVTHPTAAKAVRTLQRMGFIQEVTGRRRDQRFCATRLLQAIEAGAEPNEDTPD